MCGNCCPSRKYRDRLLPYNLKLNWFSQCWFTAFVRLSLPAVGPYSSGLAFQASQLTTLSSSLGLFLLSVSWLSIFFFPAQEGFKIFALLSHSFLLIFYSCSNTLISKCFKRKTAADRWSHLLWPQGSWLLRSWISCQFWFLILFLPRTMRSGLLCLFATTSTLLLSRLIHAMIW